MEYCAALQYSKENELTMRSSHFCSFFLNCSPRLNCKSRGKIILVRKCIRVHAPFTNILGGLVFLDRFSHVDVTVLRICRSMKRGPLMLIGKAKSNRLPVPKQLVNPISVCVKRLTSSESHPRPCQLQDSIIRYINLLTPTLNRGLLALMTSLAFSPSLKDNSNSLFFILRMHPVGQKKLSLRDSNLPPCSVNGITETTVICYHVKGLTY
jgi:hypothetical protein